MFRRAIILIGMLAALTALSGCASKPPLVTEGEVVIDGAAGGSRQLITVKLRNVVRINLPPVRTPGHAWTIVANDYRFLQPHEPLTVAPDGSAKASFIAVRQGRRPLRFFALPPGVNVAIPSQAAEMVITIQ